MKITVKYLLIALAFGTGSCEQKYQSPEDYYANYNHDDFHIQLEAGKSLGTGQYQMKGETGQELPVKLKISSSSPITDFRITKTKNRVVDPSFGNNGMMTIPVSGNTFSYDLIYKAVSSDVDELIGLTFEAVNASGQKEVSDLTLKITLSPRDNLPRRSWNLVSILHLNEGNAEVIKDCEKDNGILFNANGTLSYFYGQDTGAGDCIFDGFNVYDRWTLSEDGKTFSIHYHGIFDPTPKTDVYKVVSLTTEEIKLEQEVDLTVLGLGVERFLYTYSAGVR